MATQWNESIEEKHRIYSKESSPSLDPSAIITSRYCHVSQPCHVLLEGITTRGNADNHGENENVRSVSGTTEKYNMSAAVIQNVSPATSSISTLLSDEESLQPSFTSKFHKEESLHTQMGSFHHTDIFSRGNNKRDRWSNLETAALLSTWKENLNVLETGFQSRGWKHIMAAVNSIGSGKSIKQVKTKMKNMKDLYKNARRNRNTAGNITGEVAQFPRFYHEIDEILRDSVTMETTMLPKVVNVSGNYNNTMHQVDLNTNYVIQHDKEETENENNKDDNMSLLAHTQHLFSSSVDRSISGEVSDEEESGTSMTSSLNQPGTSNTTQKKVEKQRKKAFSFYNEMMLFQREVLMVQMEQEQKHQAFMREIIEAQRRSEAEERRKDRDFFLQLAHIFKNSK